MKFGTSRGGFSLLEMIISLSILALSVLLIIGLFISMTARTDADGEKNQVSGLLQSYQSEIKGNPESDWLNIMALGAAGFQETRPLLGETVDLKTTVTRLSSNSNSPDYQVYLMETEATWTRKSLDGGQGPERARLKLVSQMSPVGRY